MKYSLSSPSIMDKNNKFKIKINKLLLHDLNDSESKSKILSRIQKFIKTEKSLYNQDFHFNYSNEYHLARNHIRQFDKMQKEKKDIINYLRNENKKFKKIFQTNSKEFKALSFNSLNKQKNLKKTLTLLINNNYENNIFIESPLLMSNNKDINTYYSTYDEHNENVYIDKNTKIPIIDEENDESIKFSHKLLSCLYGKSPINKNIKSILNNNSNKSYNEEKFWKYNYQNKKKYKNLMKEIVKENLEIKNYNNSIKKLLDDIKRTKRHSTKLFQGKNSSLKLKGLGNSKINMLKQFGLGDTKFQRRKSVGNISINNQLTPIQIFEKLFKDIIKSKNSEKEKEKSVSHLESIYNDIIKIKDKFLSYKIDKKLNISNFNYFNLRKRNKILIEKEKREDKKIENLDFEFLWRFHNYNNYK